MEKPHSENLVKSLISPFGLVLVLTVVTFFLVFVYGVQSDFSKPADSIINSLKSWQNGFFGLIGFTLQMMMILVFGYALAIFKPVNSFLKRLSSLPKNLVEAVVLTACVTMISGLLNWGFGLIVGALLARFMHEALTARSKGSNPALLAASGYLGMGIWHGGLSGSAPLSVAEQGHFLESKIGVVPVGETLLSEFNLLSTSGLFLVFLATAWYLARISSKTIQQDKAVSITAISSGKENNLARIAGLLMLVVILCCVIFTKEKGLGFISLNWVNFLLFSLALVAYRSTSAFGDAVGSGLRSSSDIFIQFPFYAGILGLITDSGLLSQFARMSTEVSSPEFVALLSFFSAALVNLFIPSGGGQWAIQGPIILEAAGSLGINSGKMILCFAYGDQISNLLQPFWALPLLTITGVSVRKIFPYTLIFFLVGVLWLGCSILWMI